MFQMELEKALQVGCRTIIIEPSSLGASTRSWVTLGRIIKNVSLGSGLTTFLLGVSFSDWPALPLPFGLTSVFCWGLHRLSWESDPCSQYQVETKRRHLSRTSLNTVTSLPQASGPIILVKSPSRAGHFLTPCLALSAIAYAIWKLKST